MIRITDTKQVILCIKQRIFLALKRRWTYVTFSYIAYRLLASIRQSWMQADMSFLHYGYETITVIAR